MLKLTLDLIPQSAFYKNVRSEVSKSEWDKIRKEVYKKAGYICEICGKKDRLDAHEIFEYDEINNIQKLIGLVALCRLNINNVLDFIFEKRINIRISSIY